jgi:hypothetical protein
MKKIFTFAFLLALSTQMYAQRDYHGHDYHDGPSFDKSDRASKTDKPTADKPKPEPYSVEKTNEICTRAEIGPVSYEKCSVKNTETGKNTVVTRTCTGGSIGGSVGIGSVRVGGHADVKSCQTTTDKRDREPTRFEQGMFHDK